MTTQQQVAEHNAPVSIKVNMKGALSQEEQLLQPDVYAGEIISARHVMSNQNNPMLQIRTRIDGHPNIVYSNMTWHAEGSERYLAQFFYAAGFSIEDIEDDDFDLLKALPDVLNKKVGVEVGIQPYQGRRRNTARGFCRVSDIPTVRARRMGIPGGTGEPVNVPAQVQTPTDMLDENAFNDDE